MVRKVEPPSHQTLIARHKTEDISIYRRDSDGQYVMVQNQPANLTGRMRVALTPDKVRYYCGLDTWTVLKEVKDRGAQSSFPTHHRK